jgi:hypothetical protein
MTPVFKASMAENGVFSLHTCTATGLVPFVHLESLLSSVFAAHGSETEHDDTAALRAVIQKEFDQWFLTQTLNAVSRHSML